MGLVPRAHPAGRSRRTRRGGPRALLGRDGRRPRRRPDRRPTAERHRPRPVRRRPDARGPGGGEDAVGRPVEPSRGRPHAVRGCRRGPPGGTARRRRTGCGRRRGAPGAARLVRRGPDRTGAPGAGTADRPRPHDPRHAVVVAVLARQHRTGRRGAARRGARPADDRRVEQPLAVRVPGARPDGAGRPRPVRAAGLRHEPPAVAVDGRPRGVPAHAVPARRAGRRPDRPGAGLRPRRRAGRAAPLPRRPRPGRHRDDDRGGVRPGVPVHRHPGRRPRPPRPRRRRLGGDRRRHGRGGVPARRPARHPAAPPARPDRRATADRTVVRDGMLRGWVQVDGAAAGHTDVVLGISTVSIEDARANARAAGDVDTMCARAEAAWTAALGTLEVEGATPDQLVSLYSGLYRLFLFPLTAGETARDGVPRYRSPYGDVLAEPIRDARAPRSSRAPSAPRTGSGTPTGPPGRSSRSSPRTGRARSPRGSSATSGTAGGRRGGVPPAPRTA